MHPFEVERYLRNAVGLTDRFSSTWGEYLKNNADLIIVFEGLKVYKTPDCWYIVCPNGFVEVACEYNVYTLFGYRTGFSPEQVKGMFDKAIKDRKLLKYNLITCYEKLPNGDYLKEEVDIEATSDDDAVRQSKYILRERVERGNSLLCRVIDGEYRHIRYFADALRDEYL
jgi:hypothetical protein